MKKVILHNLLLAGVPGLGRKLYKPHNQAEEMPSKDTERIQNFSSMLHHEKWMCLAQKSFERKAWPRRKRNLQKELFKPLRNIQKPASQQDEI
ncbi:hypothetical protein A6R68_15581 [Neotoma lepida]|uniref:Uncharacterized protein n=1 Tax=Neotoma lepida TaxID=56216 RepID=A0A1A6H6E4_NEOLE|nr:hypothetical protein A6R68_15581 [Neotoma lepida]